MADGEPARERSIEAVARLYHDALTALILTVVVQRGREVAADLVFRLFRRKHQEQFLPGLEKLGLRGLPPAVAAAQYHYLSNQLGGVKVEYIYESDRKAWIRYPPPRWIWAGTAIAAIPTEVSQAMLRGWHAHNGISLGVPELGFVCTGQTVDGEPGLEGYYFQYDTALAPEQRLRMARGEVAPPFDPISAPRVPAADWPPERRAKAYRNYAMDYVRTAWRVLLDTRGPLELVALGGRAARLVGMQLYDELISLTGAPPDGSLHALAHLLRSLGAGQDDNVETDVAPAGLSVRQHTWRLMRGIEPLHPALFTTWQELLLGLVSAHDRFLEPRLLQRLDRGDRAFEWLIARRAQ